jgi:hypothetical protein
MPVFEELIHDKWQKFALRYHIMFAVIPYFCFVGAFTFSALSRAALVREAQLGLSEAGGAGGAGGAGAAPLDLRDEASSSSSSSFYSYSYSSSSVDAEIQLLVACDVCAYGLGFPYLCWNAYFHSRLGRRYLNVTHVNEGKQITWRDFVMWTFKNINPVLCALVATLLLITAVLRLASSSNWLVVSHQSLTQVSLRALLLTLGVF